jgi:hypothetical protein
LNSLTPQIYPEPFARSLEEGLAEWAS